MPLRIRRPRKSQHSPARAVFVSAMTRIAIESFHSMPHQEGEERACFFFQQPEDSILLLRSQGRKRLRGKLSTRQLIKLLDAIEVQLRVIAVMGGKRLFDIDDDSGLHRPPI